MQKCDNHPTRDDAIFDDIQGELLSYCPSCFSCSLPSLDKVIWDEVQGELEGRKEAVLVVLLPRTGEFDVVVRPENESCKGAVFRIFTVNKNIFEKIREDNK